MRRFEAQATSASPRPSTANRTDQPARLIVLDGEIVALGEDEWPDFPSVCERLLNGNRSIPLIYIVFDVLEHDGRSTMHLPFRERRQLLDWLRLHGPNW